MISEKESKRRAKIRANWKAGMDLMMSGQTQEGYALAFCSKPEMRARDLEWLKAEADLKLELFQFAKKFDDEPQAQLRDLVTRKAKAGHPEALRLLVSGVLDLKV